MKRFLQSLAADLAPLWVGGLAVLQIYVLGATLPQEGEALEWAQYLLLGTVFPLLVLLLALGSQSLLFRNRFWICLPALLSLVCIYPIVDPRVRAWSICLAYGTCQLLILLVMLHLRRECLALVFPARPSGIAVGIAVTFLGWFFFREWVWWRKFPDWLVDGPLRLSITWGALLAATITVAGLFLPAASVSRRLRFWTCAPALVAFAWLSTRVYGTGMRGAIGSVEQSAFHHWGVIVESAEQVRQGGWLLWEVPGQYGFLNTLMVAVLPVGSVWQSLYLCSAVLMTLSAFIVFWLLWSLRPSLFQAGIALLIAASAVFMMPGDHPGLTGPFPFPALGAFRFFWCYALLRVLAWDYDAVCAGQVSRRRTLWVGTLTWLLGSLWSAESAAFCATIWLPCYTLLVLRRSVVLLPGPGIWRRRLAVVAAWLALPPILLAGAVAFLCVVYELGRGVLPELRCFLDYCFALQFFALPIRPGGAVGVLVLAFVLIATIGAYSLRDADPLQPLPLVVGAAAALWAASSYFVVRSLENDAVVLMPLAVASIASALRVLDRVPPNEAWSSWIKVSLLPFFAVLLVMPFVEHGPLQEYVNDAARGYCPDLTELLPDADPALQQLLQESGADADTPIAYFDNRRMFPSSCPRWIPKKEETPLSAPRYWLPASMALCAPLSEDRRHVYFERYAAGARRSGWLIRPNDEPGADLAWILAEVGKTHVPGRMLHNAQWIMTWYEFDAKK